MQKISLKHTVPPISRNKDIHHLSISVKQRKQIICACSCKIHLVIQSNKEKLQQKPINTIPRKLIYEVNINHDIHS
jgi:hypothetical protein